MSELQLMVLVLAVIYGWECLAWLRRGGVAFRTDWRGHWRLAHPAAVLGNQTGGVVVAQPLPPLGYLVTAYQSPLSCSPDGVFSYVAQCVNPGWRPPQAARYFSFAEIKTITVVNRQVRLNNTLLLSAASVYQAEHLAGQLRQLLPLDPARRANAIRALQRDSLDTKAIQQRWEAFLVTGNRLRWLANGLLAYLFVLAPTGFWYFGFVRGWLPLLLGLLAFTITNTVLFHRAHRRLYPKADDDRLTQDCLILLAPATSARSHDALARHLLEPFHPLAVAQLFLPAAEFRAFARRVLLELRHPCLPVCPATAPAGAAAAEVSSRTAWLTEVEAFVAKHGISLPELLRPPERTEPGVQSYCPRCEAQFTAATGECTDCGGLPLVRFPGA